MFVGFPFGRSGREGIILGKPLAVLDEDILELRAARQVFVLTWVGPVIIKFLAPVSVADVTPVLAANGVVAVVPGGERWAIPDCIRIVRIVRTVLGLPSDSARNQNLDGFRKRDAGHRGNL